MKTCPTTARCRDCINAKARQVYAAKVLREEAAKRREVRV